MRVVLLVGLLAGGLTVGLAGCQWLSQSETALRAKDDVGAAAGVGAAAPAAVEATFADDAARRIADAQHLLADDPDKGMVVATCSVCHSARLVVQNRGSRAYWLKLIRWMQDEHNLWHLAPPIEDRLLTYLAKHYGPLEDTPGARAGVGVGADGAGLGAGAGLPLRRLPLPPHLRPQGL